MSEKLYTERALLDHLGLSRSTLWRLIKNDLFPEPIRIGGSVRWTEEDVDGTIDKLKLIRAEGGL
ncbi:MAG: AlpA family phage regulatory protein [Shimia sp.]|nr:AlpA family phage regulatory protein [Shimia sp.]